MTRENLIEILESLTAVWIVLSVAAPVGWVAYQGGWDQVGWLTKAFVFGLPPAVLLLDIVWLEKRASRPGFDPWSEI